MRLSKKQQAIIGIVREQEILEKRVLFEALEGVLEEKKNIVLVTTLSYKPSRSWLKKGAWNGGKSIWF